MACGIQQLLDNFDIHLTVTAFSILRVFLEVKWFSVIRTAYYTSWWVHYSRHT